MLMLNNNNFSNSFSISFKNLLLLYITNESCQACKLFNPIFTKISQKLSKNSVQTAIVTYDSSLGEKAQNFITSVQSTPEIFIDKTPLLILFNNGSPLAKYKSDDYSESAILNFVQSVIRDIQKKETPFIPQQPTHAASSANRHVAGGGGGSLPIGGSLMQHHQPTAFFPPPSLRSLNRSANAQPTSFYGDEMPTHFDQPQYMIPKSAPVNWLLKNKNFNN